MGNVWIATSGGLVRFDDNKNIFERQEINGKPIIGNTLSVLPDGIFFAPLSTRFTNMITKQKNGKHYL